MSNVCTTTSGGEANHSYSARKLRKSVVFLEMIRAQERRWIGSKNSSKKQLTPEILWCVQIVHIIQSCMVYSQPTVSTACWQQSFFCSTIFCFKFLLRNVSFCMNKYVFSVFCYFFVCVAPRAYSPHHFYPFPDVTLLVSIYDTSTWRWKIVCYARITTEVCSLHHFFPLFGNCTYAVFLSLCLGYECQYGSVIRKMKKNQMKIKRTEIWICRVVTIETGWCKFRAH